MPGRPLILLTRPRAEAEEFAALLESEGFDSLVVPMLEIEPFPYQVSDLSRYQGLVFTSANGVRAFARKSWRRDLPVYAVGPQTAAASREAGFKEIHEGGGDAAALIDLIRENIPAGGKSFLHIRGDRVAVPVAETLRKAGYEIAELVAYASRKIDEPELDVGACLRVGMIDAVAFFSKRTARQFMDVAVRKGFEKNLMGVKALCLSDSVLECVRPESWGGAYAASRPDREGMLALIREAVKIEPQAARPTSMNLTDQTTIPDAEKIIERFGGIRPMASKMEIPVTTVQGWKKRNAIPASRKEDIVAAARIHNVPISDLIDGASVANENLSPERPAGSSVPPVNGFTAGAPNVAARPQVQVDALEARFEKIVKASVARGAIVNGVLILISVAAVIALLWPAAKHNEEQIQAVQMQVEEVQQEQSSLRNLIPTNLQERLNRLQEQAQNIQQSAGAAIGQAETISNDVIGPDAGTLEQRITRLETHVAEMGGSPQVLAALEKVKSLQQTELGQQQLDEVVKFLSSAVGGAQTDEQMAQKIEEAKTQNAAVGDTLAGVPPEDLKAAALLVGLSQFRESLNRDNEPFGDDLQLLQKLVGDEDPALKESLTRLAPQAEKGVLTPQGLSNEFKSLTGDIVVSSLKGEDVSIQEKAKARMNELLSVEKDGQLITGTDTQATVARAQNFLNQGDLAGAIGQVESLEGPAAQTAAPWLDQARATLIAQQAKELVSRTINLRAFGGARGITAGGAGGIGAIMGAIPGAGSELIQDKESGINVLKPAPRFPGQ